MIRITGGERRGMTLTSPSGHETRPATAQVRQWIFDVLGSPRELSVLDLFAGTGAVGIEALSRGARLALFVESGKPALNCLQANLEKTRYEATSEVMRMDVEQAACRLKETDRRFDLCFCDPPYRFTGLEKLLAESVLELIAPGGTLVVEHRGDPPLAPRGLSPDREHVFGDTVLSLWIDLEHDTEE
ncbi:RsmD family RNA methyltransferase [Candidatus Zixiibacteriota bacterium]